MLDVPRFFQYWQPDSLTAHVARSGPPVRQVAVDVAQPRDWIQAMAVSDQA